MLPATATVAGRRSLFCRTSVARLALSTSGRSSRGAASVSTARATTTTPGLRLSRLVASDDDDDDDYDDYDAAPPLGLLQLPLQPRRRGQHQASFGRSVSSSVRSSSSGTCWGIGNNCANNGKYYGYGSSRSRSSVAAVQRQSQIMMQQQQQQQQQQPQRRHLSFSYAGPRSLREILKVELLESLEASEISDLWLSHHETKERVVGMCLKGDEGTRVLERASQCRFYVQPIFRDDGFFMLLSQFQDPNHFLLAYLEDYKMDPTSATPLLTFAVFTDFAETKDLALVRADVLNASITDDEAYKVVSSVLSNYKSDDEYGSVQTFNRQSSDFDVDDYISRMNDRWNQT